MSVFTVSMFNDEGEEISSYTICHGKDCGGDNSDEEDDYDFYSALGQRGSLEGIADVFLFDMAREEGNKQ